MLFTGSTALTLAMCDRHFQLNFCIWLFSLFSLSKDGLNVSPGCKYRFLFIDCWFNLLSLRLLIFFFFKQSFCKALFYIALYKLAILNNRC